VTAPVTVTSPNLPKVRANLIQGRSTPMVLVDQFVPERVTMRLEIQDAERLLLELTAALHDLELGR
jgi:hypothetical protein